MFVSMRLSFLKNSKLNDKKRNIKKKKNIEKIKVKVKEKLLAGDIPITYLYISLVFNKVFEIKKENYYTDLPWMMEKKHI